MNKKINLITASTIDGFIGSDGVMPWHIPEDLKYYKEKTINNIIIMGRLTYNQLPSVALRHRIHIILTRDEQTSLDAPDGVEVYIVNSIEDAIKKARELAIDDKKIFVAGGGIIYNQMIDYCDTCYITWINKTFGKMDISFPIEKLSQFKCIKTMKWKRSKNDYQYKFNEYER